MCHRMDWEFQRTQCKSFRKWNEVGEGKRIRGEVTMGDKD